VICGNHSWRWKISKFPTEILVGFFTSVFEICLVVTNNNHEETTTEHLFVDYIVVSCYSWMFQPLIAIIRQTIFILYFKLAVSWMLCLSFGWFLGIWILCANVSEHNVPSS